MLSHDVMKMKIHGLVLAISPLAWPLEDIY